MEKKTKHIVNTLVLAAILIFVMVLVSQTIGLGRGGFDSTDVLTQFFFYIGPGIAYLAGILLLFAVGLYLTKNDKAYGNDSIAFSDLGEKPAFSFFKKFTQIQLLWLSTIVFFSVGLIAFLTKQESFTGLRMLEQQFTAIDSILFSSAMIPIAENLGLAFLIAMSLFGLRFISRKYNISSENFLGFAYFVVPLGALYGLANHLLRYSGSDIDKIVVFMFWGFGTLITLVTGSFIPFLMMHISNNMLFDLGRFFSNESLLIYFGAGLILLTIGYFIVYKDRLLGGKI